MLGVGIWQECVGAFWEDRLVGKPQWLARVAERLFTAREHICHGASLGVWKVLLALGVW